MAGLAGTPILSWIDIYSSDTTVPSGYQVGMLMEGPDGKAFRYALAGELLVVGDINQSSVVDAQFDDMAVATNTAIGSATLPLTNGTTAVLANQYDGGTAEVSVTPGLGDEYTILGHTNPISGAAFTLTLDRTVRTAVTSAASKVTVRRSPWSGIIKCPTTLTGTVAGVTVFAVPSASYGWVQTKGVAAVLADSSTGVVGSDVGVPGASAGAVGVNIAGSGKSNSVGRAMRALASGKTVPVYLCID